MARKEWSGNQGRGLWDNVPIGADEERRIQAGIDATMRQIISDPYKNPQALDAPEKATPIDAPTVTTVREKASEKGWYEAKSLAPSRQTEELIKGLTDHFEPHGDGSPLRKGEK
jgi:hypothetical protein